MVSPYFFVKNKNTYPSSFIWNVADDVLRGLFKLHEYCFWIPE